MRQAIIFVDSFSPKTFYLDPPAGHIAVIEEVLGQYIGPGERRRWWRASSGGTA